MEEDDPGPKLMLTAKGTCNVLSVGSEVLCLGDRKRKGERELRGDFMCKPLLLYSLPKVVICGPDA